MLEKPFLQSVYHDLQKAFFKRVLEEKIRSVRRKYMNTEKKTEMFCFQCEQTAGCTGCTKAAGVCGKTAEVAALQDELTGALIGLARTCMSQKKTDRTDRLVIEGLFSTLTNVSFDEEALKKR